MLGHIRAELERLAASEIEVALDEAFAPEAGPTLRIQWQEAYWHLLPEDFLELIRELPDAAGPAEIHRAIETRATAVWHGPSPRNSRDT